MQVRVQQLEDREQPRFKQRGEGIVSQQAYMTWTPACTCFGKWLELSAALVTLVLTGQVWQDLYVCQHAWI
jgi:hypothetical protein